MINETMLTLQDCTAANVGINTDLTITLCLVGMMALVLMMAFVATYTECQRRRKYIIETKQEQAFQEWNADRRKYLD